MEPPPWHRERGRGAELENGAARPRIKKLGATSSARHRTIGSCGIHFETGFCESNVAIERQPVYGPPTGHAQAESPMTVYFLRLNFATFEGLILKASHVVSKLTLCETVRKIMNYPH